MGHVIAIANEKGGVGKTTLAVNVGAALAIRGKRVLLVDMDPQGNSSFILLPNSTHDDVPTIYNVLTTKNVTLASIIQPTGTENFCIAPSNLHLAGAEITLAQEYGRENVLKRKLTDDVKKAYDFILIDTSPSLGLLTINAFTTADYALIPVACDFLSLVGLNLLLDTIKLAQENLGSAISILGFVLNRYDRRVKISDEVVDIMKSKFPRFIFDTLIRINVKLEEAPARHMTIFEYDPVCPGAKDHLALANEIIDKLT
jgi:chromosome partitioning protein